MRRVIGSPMLREAEAHIMFIGDSGTGKSCYAQYLQSGKPVDEDDLPEATIGVHFEIFSRTPENAPRGSTTVRFVLIDAAGQDRFRHTLPSSYRRAKVVVFMYDVTSRESFDALRSRWWPEVREHARDMRVALVIGNKADIVRKDPSMRRVTVEEGNAFAKLVNAIGFFERSALEDERADVFWPIDLCAIRLAEVAARDPPAHWAGGATEETPIITLKSEKKTDEKTPGACCS